MSMMLNFFDSLWLSARKLADAGHKPQAVATLAPLLHSPQTPPKYQILAHRLSARIALDSLNYRLARKHLRLAIRLQPQEAELHYELGFAFETDPHGCDRRAARCFKRAVLRNSRCGKYSAALGRALVRIQRTRVGVKYLRDAANLMPREARVLSVVVEGLNLAGCCNLAWKVATKARFLAPHDRAIQKLWDDTRFVRSATRPKCSPLQLPPKTLPFVPMESENGIVSKQGEGEVLRRDRRSAPAPHILRMPTPRMKRG